MNSYKRRLLQIINIFDHFRFVIQKDICKTCIRISIIQSLNYSHFGRIEADNQSVLK